MKTSEILKFTQTGGDISFDFSTAAISIKHAMQYLAYLKVKFTAVNYDASVVIEYMRASQLLGKTNLQTDFMNLICIRVHNHMWTIDSSCLSEDELRKAVELEPTLIDAHINLIKSLPLFLAVKAGQLPPTADGNQPNVGVNFARFFEDPAFLSYILMGAMTDSDNWKSAPYYPTLFDGYQYGGDNLIWFVTSNPNCELTKGHFL